MVAGPGPEKPRPLVDCRESQRAEAPCASVNSEATSGSERSSRSPPSPVQFWFCLGPRHCHRFCSVWVPSMVVGSGSGSVWAPARSSVLVPSGPPARSSVLVPSGPPARSSVLGLVPFGPPAQSSLQSTSSTCGLGGCLAGRAAAGSQTWCPSPHSAGSGRAAPVQGRPPGAPLPRLSGQLPDRTVPRGRTADVSSQNR